MRTLNVRLAAILLAVGVVFCVGVYFLHGYQVRRNAYVFEREAERAQERASQAAEEKNPRLELQARRDAARNLGWYVRLAPDDVDALERYALLTADLAQNTSTFSARMLSQGYGLLEGVLRLDPSRTSVRRRLVDMAMMIRRHQDAKDHLDVLRNDSPKDAELLELLGRCNAEMGDSEEAVKNFKKAIKLKPSQVDVYPRLAAVLRYSFATTKDIKEADQWMLKLVEVNAKSHRAHFLRGNYLRENNASDEALKEALKSLELAPDNRDALWLTAQCYLAKTEFAKARECAARGIELYPGHIEMYVVMADIEFQDGKRDKAVTAFEDGLKATERSPRLLWSMANLLIDVNRLKEAEKINEELRNAEYAKQLIDYLDARIAMARGQWLVARWGFEKVRGTLTVWPSLVKQIDVWIGRCYGQLGNRDLQLEAYRRALKIDPNFAPARAGVTDALMGSGDIKGALSEFGQLKKSGKVGSGSKLAEARMLVEQNLRQSPAERNWAPVEQLLDEAEKAMPDVIQIPLLRAEVLLAQDRPTDAERMVEKARAKNPQQIELWGVLVSLAVRQRDWPKTEALLEECRKASGDTVNLRLAQSQYFVRRYGQEASDRLRKLAENADRFADADRLRLWNGLMNAAIQAGDIDQATQLGGQIAKKEPYNVQVRYVLFEQAMRARDNAGMDQALKEIERVAGQGAYWHYGQAVRLSMQAKDNKDAGRLLDEALKHLSQSQELLQSWSRVPLLMAGIYDQQGKTDEALQNYLAAIEMGERNPAGIHRTLQLLFQKVRFFEADRLLRQLEKQQASFTPEMYRAAAEIALRRGEYARALEMVRKVASAESKNGQESLWLGQVLGIIGRRAKAEGKTRDAERLLGDAEKAHRRAVELDPKIPAAWVALVQFLIANNAEEEAEKAVKEAGAKIPAKQAPLALAQCYEAMKKTEPAREKYEAALAATPEDPVVVRTVADFYSRSGKPAMAEVLLRRIIDGKVGSADADVLWARRQLALVYANRGGYQNVVKARDLIKKNLEAASEASILDQRLMASLDAYDPNRSGREKAIKMLEAMQQDKSATPQDLFQLGQLYLDAGSWVKASSVFRNLVAAHEDEPRYLATYIAALLEHGETSNAEVWLDRLERTQAANVITVGLRAETLVAKNEPDVALELLAKFIDMPDARPADRKVRICLVAEKCEQLAARLAKKAQQPTADRFAGQADTLYRTYVGQDPRQQSVLTAFLARQGRTDDALELLDRTWKGGTPAEFAQECSVILHSGKVSKQQMQRLDGIQQAALRHFDRPVPLLMAMADFCSKQARYADAEKLYREILEKNKNNVYAMNNLAVLLALQGVKAEESLKLIDQAVKIAGPVGAMLDSRASVYLALGQPEKALADMADALADAETPVRLFHQAQAYLQAGRNGEAAAAMKKAVDKGLTKEMLQPLELPAFEKLAQLPK